MPVFPLLCIFLGGGIDTTESSRCCCIFSYIQWGRCEGLLAACKSGSWKWCFGRHFHSKHRPFLLFSTLFYTKTLNTMVWNLPLYKALLLGRNHSTTALPGFHFYITLIIFTLLFYLFGNSLSLHTTLFRSNPNCNSPTWCNSNLHVYAQKCWRCTFGHVASRVFFFHSQARGRNLRLFYACASGPA